MTQTNSFMSYANNSSFDGRNCPSAFACDNACATYEAANESANGGAAYIVAVPLFLVALVFVIISVVSVIARNNYCRDSRRAHYTSGRNSTHNRISKRKLLK